ncbi:DNA polymerase epsilon subunit 3-like [Dysidea avara]|uniref:DNA polymerase epsilon subunit 3-like n=1 Tax=Dysidea avara TaxID=196820 RepID=UPI00332DDA45
MAEKPEDLTLPASVVARIIKESLPEGVNVSKEARTAIGKAACIFVLYTTACSNNFAIKAKRKTLAAGDVFNALGDMEFEQLVPDLKQFLEAYKEEQKGKKEAAASDKKRRQAEAMAQQADDSVPMDQTPAPSTSETPAITTTEAND